MNTDGKEIAYDVIMALLSSLSIILGIVLAMACKKKPVESEETLPIKLCAETYTLTEMDSATGGFNPTRIIGQGRLGAVYAGVLSRDGELVAVKRIHPRLVLSNAGFGFSAVIRSMSLALHPNIVPVLGYSQAPGERIIVSEYIGLGSLDFYLHQNPEGAALLDWGRRLRIASGAARGLEYLHEGTAPSIVHGCMKSSNILIDDKFSARICDFGLSFLAPQEKKGLVGFVDGEYWTERGGACKEADVYGFGVVLLEILTGRRSEGGLLAKWALPLIKELRFSELLDPRLVIPSDVKPLVRLGRVALACVGNSRQHRPSMVQVVAILSNLEMELSCL